MSVPNNINTSEIVSGYYYRWFYDQFGNQTSSTGKVIFGQDTVKSDVRTIVSATTPGFRKLNRWALPINRYSKTTSWVRDPLQVLTYSVPSGSGKRVDEYHRGLRSSWLHVPSLFPQSAAADDPTQKVKAKIFDEIRLGKTNSLVTLAEGHKTAAMVAKNATKIAKAVIALKNFRFGDFASALGLVTEDWQRKRFYRQKLRLSRLERTQSLSGYNKAYKDFVSNTWLEYSYGWKPLLNDIYNSAEALATLLHTSGNAVRYATAKAKTSAVGNWVVTGDGLLYFKDQTHERAVAIGVYYSIPTGQVSAEKAFGLLNPAELVWELIPFSFVADWFIPIGTALSSLTATSGLTFHKGWMTTKERRGTIYRVAPSGKRDSSNGTWTGSGTSGDETFTITREPLTTWMDYGFPQFKNPLSFAHAASAVALLHSLFGKGNSIPLSTLRR